jgi:hypothetical protein
MSGHETSLNKKEEREKIKIRNERIGSRQENVIGDEYN